MSVTMALAKGYNPSEGGYIHSQDGTDWTEAEWAVK